MKERKDERRKEKLSPPYEMMVLKPAEKGDLRRLKTAD